jgi:hypothetical protein
MFEVSAPGRKPISPEMNAFGSRRDPPPSKPATEIINARASPTEAMVVGFLRIDHSLQAGLTIAHKVYRPRDPETTQGT